MALHCTTAPFCWHSCMYFHQGGDTSIASLTKAPDVADWLGMTTTRPTGTTFLTWLLGYVWSGIWPKSKNIVFSTTEPQWPTLPLKTTCLSWPFSEALFSKIAALKWTKGISVWWRTALVMHCKLQHRALLKALKCHHTVGLHYTDIRPLTLYCRERHWKSRKKTTLIYCIPLMAMETSVICVKPQVKTACCVHVVQHSHIAVYL